jgi:hypothetical protein
MSWNIPFSFIVDYKLEDAVPIWCTECDGVLAGRASHGFEGGADVGVEHCEFELEIFESRIGLPQRGFWVVPRDISRVDLREKNRKLFRGVREV